MKNKEKTPILKGYISNAEERAEILYNHLDNERTVRYVPINYDEIGLQSIEEYKEIPIAEPVMYIEKPVYTTRQRDLEQERRNAVNNARIQQRTVKGTPNENPQTRIDYINKQVKLPSENGLKASQRTNEAFEMGKKRISLKPKKNYEEIAELFYPNMEVKSQINPPIKKDYILQEQEQNLLLETEIPEISNAEKTLYPNETLAEMEPKKLYDLTKDENEYILTGGAADFVSSNTYSEIKNMAQTQPDKNFFAALDFVYGNEGGYSNRSTDRGGKTNFGVTQITYNDYCRRHHLPIKNVKNLSKEETIQVYYNDYWIKSGAAASANLINAIVLFDTATLHGYPTARIYNKKANNDPYKILQLRKEHYIQKVKKEPDQLEYFNGWMNRVNRLQQLLENAKKVNLI